MGWKGGCVCGWVGGWYGLCIGAWVDAWDGGCGYIAGRVGWCVHARERACLRDGVQEGTTRGREGTRGDMKGTREGRDVTRGSREVRAVMRGDMAGGIAES